MTETRPKRSLPIHDDAELAPRAPIAGTLASLWGVALLISLLGAGDVTDTLAGWDRLARLLPTGELGAALESVHDGLGLRPLHGSLEAARHALNEPYAVGRPAQASPSVEPEDALVEPSDEDHPAHRRAPAKRRVLVIGASSIQFALGVELERRFPSYEKVKVKRHGVLATSLARPDFYDWPKKAEALIREFKPDLIVTNYGGNDAQDILRPDGTKVPYDSPAWDTAFQALVTELIELGRRHRADTVMIGMPVMREAKFTRKMKRLNAAMEEATVRAGGLYVSTWELSSDASGGYLASARWGGKRGLLRTSDGVHYSKLGAEMVVEEALSRIERRFRLVPSDPALGRAEPHGFESKRLGRAFNYTAYLPRRRPEAPAARPVVVLAPGVEAELGEVHRHPHRRLQAWAERDQATLILLEDETLAAIGSSGLAEETLRELITAELLPDLTAHFPSSGPIRLLASPGPLAEAWSAAVPDSPPVLLPGAWTKGLEDAVRGLSAPAPTPP